MEILRVLFAYWTSSVLSTHGTCTNTAARDLIYMCNSTMTPTSNDLFRHWNYVAYEWIFFLLQQT